MRARFLFFALVAVMAWPAAAMAQGQRQAWVSREAVAQNAHDVQSLAEELANTAREQRGYGYLADDASTFAREAQRFHNLIERGAPYGQVMREYRSLQDRYYGLRDSVFRSYQDRETRQVARQWLQLASGFEQLALTIGSSGVQPSDRYRDDRRHDRRYDDRYDRYDRYEPRRQPRDDDGGLLDDLFGN